MATISSGSVTVTIQPGEQYRVIASGEAYVDIGGGSTESYRLTGATSEKLLGGFIVATPVTVRVVSGVVYYNEINNPISAGLTNAQIDAGATGVAGTDGAGNFIDGGGNMVVASYVGPISSGRGIPNHIYGAMKSVQSFNVHKVSARTNKIRLTYMPMLAGSSGESAYTGTITQEAFVQIKGQWFRVTYAGQNVGTFAVGLEYKSDFIDLPFYIDSNDEIFELDNATTSDTNGMFIFKDTAQWAGFGQWISTFRNSSTFQEINVVNGIPQLPTVGVVNGLTWVTTMDMNYYGANRGCSAIEGLTNKPSVGIIGDSHQNIGAGDKSQNTIIDKYGINGVMASICHANNIPFKNVGWSGESYTRITVGNAFAQRAQHISDCAIISDSLGFNDVGAGAAYTATWTNTLGSTAVTGATFSPVPPTLNGLFIRDPSFPPNAYIVPGSVTGSNGSYAFSVSVASMAASTGATCTQGTNFTSAAFREFIRLTRNIVPNGWNKAWLHDCLNQRVTVNATNGEVTASNATETLNAFNFWNRTGILAARINRGDGVLQSLIDGFIDTPSAIDDGSGLLKRPSNYKAFTPGSGGGINTFASTLNAFRVQSSTGNFLPDYNDALLIIAGAGTAGATIRVPSSRYLSENWIQMCMPFTYFDGSMTNCTNPQNSTSITTTRANTTTTDTTMYVNPPCCWKISDGFHDSRLGILEKIKLGNYKALTNLFVS